jgi:hypothetical protein
MSIVAGTGVTVSRTGSAVTINSSGGVGSVGLSLPSIFTVTGSPVTTSGTLTATLASQATSTILAAPIGGGTPTFRGVAVGELSDVLIQSATAGQVLSFDGTNWANAGSSTPTSASGLVGAGQAGIAAWALVSGNTYTADFAHNLGTTNVVITIFDSSTLAIVTPDLVTCTNVNTVRVRVSGNTRTLKVVVIANGLSVSTAPTTDTDARFTYVANSLDSPSNADFVVNSLAPTTTDPTYNALNVRSFSNTVEQGVAFTCSIPPGATQVILKFRGRAATAPGAAAVVQFRLYARQVPNNAAMGSWSAANELTNIAIPTNAFFQYASQTITFATLGLTADRLYQFELTRRVSGVTGTNLASAFYLAEVVCEFS